MTPKEKAVELRFTFWRYADVDSGQATRCAIISVDEILLSGVDTDIYYFDKSLGYAISFKEYYQEVKEELKKL
jgi:hypothetical protein